MDQQRVLGEINRARSDPQSYIATVKSMLPRFQGTIYKTQSGQKIRLFQGKAAWSDAVLALQRQKSKASLEFSEGAMRACKIIGQRILSGQSSVDFMSVLKDFCQIGNNAVMCVYRHQVKLSVNEQVAMMVVNEGDQNRTTRVSIFHPNYSFYGCAIVTSGSSTVIPMLFIDKVLGESAPPPSSHTQSKHHQAPDVNRGQEVAEEINKCRGSAKSFVESLRKQMQQISSDGKQLNKGSYIRKIRQGKSGYEQAIQELSSLYKLPPLKWSQGAAIGCEEFVKDMMAGKKSDLNQIVARFIVNTGGFYSFIYTGLKSPRELVQAMLVSDGDRKRNARKKLISPVVKGVSAAFFEQGSEGCSAVVCFLQGFREKSDEIARYKQNAGQSENMQIEEQAEQQQMRGSTMGMSGMGMSLGLGSEQDFVSRHIGKKKVKKRSSKTSYVQVNGQKFKRIYTLIEYKNGQIQQFQEEIAMN